MSNKSCRNCIHVIEVTALSDEEVEDILQNQFKKTVNYYMGVDGESRPVRDYPEDFEAGCIKCAKDKQGRVWKATGSGIPQGCDKYKAKY